MQHSKKLTNKSGARLDSSRAMNMLPTYNKMRRTIPWTTRSALLSCFGSGHHGALSACCC
jgi:hypothetical protein